MIPVITTRPGRSAAPPLRSGIGFNAQHAPMGAFMSVTLGHPGTRGGVGVEIGRPANQDVYVGVWDGSSSEPRGDVHATKPRCLPFFSDRQGGAVGEADYLADEAGPSEAQVDHGVAAIPLRKVSRTYGWATDRWETDGLRFEILTPFGPIPDPDTCAADDIAAMRAALRPAVVGSLTIDNRDGDASETGFYAMRFAQPGAHCFEPWRTSEGVTRLGFGHRRHLGIAAELWDTTDARDARPIDGAWAFQRWSVPLGLNERHRPVHMLGTCPGIAFEVPAGRCHTLRLAWGVYLDGVVTTGQDGVYLYTRYFTGLGDVLDDALNRADELTLCADAIDAYLAESPLGDDQRFLIAHATRSYYGSTQLLEIDGRPCWIVNEGEYCMMNTLDLAIDQAFWELDRNPWVVRNLLGQFVGRYSYRDAVVDRSGVEHAGGVSFCHDMGAHNNFSPPGHSSYEVPAQTGCFSYMTMEQICNWVLLAGCYVAATDDRRWLESRAAVLDQCATSLRHRTDEHGIMTRDSSRCAGGREITTYDSLDESLGQARGNTYIAVKTWASWLALEWMHRLRTGEPLPGAMAQAIAAHLPTLADDAGTLPAVAEPDSPGHASRILPAVEALVYTAWWWRKTGDPTVRAFLRDALDSPLTETLRRHAAALLRDPDRPNLFDDGGVKLSSTSDNSWFSKIALFMHVARSVLRLDDEPDLAALMRRADAAHARWQVEGGGYWACSDQFVRGRARASRYYPRGVTSALWLDEKAPAWPAERTETAMAEKASR